MYNFFKFDDGMLLRYKEHRLRLIEMDEESVGVYEIDSMKCVFVFKLVCGKHWCFYNNGVENHIATSTALGLFNDTMQYLVRNYRHV